jgi:hypothetical protein
MDSQLLRTFWNVVIEAPSSLLLAFDDASLSQYVLNGLEEQMILNQDQQSVMSRYITSRLSLIRDLARS